MASVEKTKEWIKENIPMLAVLYENKYVGMASDRFASLPATQQKQAILGTFGAIFSIIFLFLMFSYIGLWSSSGQSQRSYEMVNLLTEYQKHRRDQGEQISNLERNNVLAAPGEFKKHLQEQGRSAAISPRMMEIEEKPDGAEEGGAAEAKGSSDVKLKQASVTLKKVNLNQLKSFLNYVEFGQYNISISSLKITNDDKIRGYMNVDVGVVAYLFQSEGGG